MPRSSESVLSNTAHELTRKAQTALLYAKLIPMRPELFLNLLADILEFIEELPPAVRSFPHISFNTRLALYHTYAIVFLNYQRELSYSQTRELTTAYINVTKAIHAKFNTRQAGPYLTRPR
jgi:hypothetical protein